MAVCRLFLLVLLWCCAANVVPARPLTSLQIELWTADRGLPHNTVLTLAQTRDGYLWIGTWEGLLRFDGSRFSEPPELPASLKHTGIQALAGDSQGSLWVGAQGGGVYRLQGGRWQTLSQPGDPLRGHVVVLLPLGGDRLYIGTSDGVLGLFEGERFRRVIVDGTAPRLISGLAQSVDGRVLACGDTGLIQLEGDRGVALEVRWPQEPPQMQRLQARRAGGFWLPTLAGLHVLEGDLMTPARVGPAAPISRMLKDAQGQIWLGADPQRLLRLRGDTIESLERRDGLPSGRIAAILDDHEGNVWLGTNGGLARLHAAPFSAITERQGLSDPYVRAVLERADGSVVVASAGGLDLLREGRVQPPPADWPAELRARPTLSLAESPDGRLLVGTSADGAWALGADGLTRLQAPAEIGANQVRAILADADGGVWYGSTSGLSHCVKDHCRRYTTDDGLGGQYITALSRDADGLLWVGSSIGASRQTATGFQALELPDGISRTVFGFHVDRAGRRWLVSDGGLGLIEGDQVRLLDATQGLIDDAVFTLLEDDDGLLWLSSNRGIQRIDPDQAIAVLDGRRQRLEGRRYGRADGLPAAQANGGSQPAGVRARDGRLWFATAGGVGVVQPAEVRTDEMLTPPRLVLDAFVIDGSAQPAATTVQLQPGQQRLQFRFSGISYSAPDRLQLRYRLAGFDTEWQTADGERLASYTNLVPGRYDFELQAGWIDQPAAGERLHVAVEVLPAWHQRGWTRLALAALTLLLIVGGIRWRIGSLRRQARQLKQLVEQRTAALQAERDALARASARNAELMAQLGRQAREDSLTGLANRREADRRLAELLATGATPTLVLIDIDHFKQINDTLGHAAGDLALQTMAAALRELAPAPALCARVGGEEFLLAFDQSGVGAVAGLLAGLRDRLRGPALPAGSNLPPLRFSAGIASVHPGESAEAAIRRADAALYRAKAEGRDQDRIAV